MVYSINPTFRNISVAASKVIGLSIIGCGITLGQTENQTDFDRQTSTQTSGQFEEEDSADIEYLTRGPLHEAFAEPYEAIAVASEIVKKRPPDAINEVPPDHRPEGENVIWISGYWAWADDREDFLWISGVWRKTPPGQRWIPGYWEELDQGYRWISGLWAGADVAEMEYLPQPPESLEQGPSSPPPGEDFFYIPGNWVYAANDYKWQPGYWARTQKDWVWSPAQYVWTPSGCVYHQGYWDYGLDNRGVVFTPVYYRQSLYQNPGYAYRPRYAIDTGLNLLVHLFIRPNFRQYYFGNYYGPRYSNQYRPWVTNFNQPRSYDPFYAHYQHRSRNQNVSMLSWVETQHQFFQSEERYRPPQTIAAQRQFMSQNRGGSLSPTVLRLATFGESFDDLVNQPGRSQRFESVNQSDLERFARSLDPMREFSRNRRDVEGQASEKRNAGSERDRGSRSSSLRLPKVEELQRGISQGTEGKSDIGRQAVEANERISKERERRSGNLENGGDGRRKDSSNSSQMRPDQPKDWPFANAASERDDRGRDPNDNTRRPRNSDDRNEGAAQDDQSRRDDRTARDTPERNRDPNANRSERSDNQSRMDARSEREEIPRLPGNAGRVQDQLNPRDMDRGSDRRGEKNPAKRNDREGAERESLPGIGSSNPSLGREKQGDAPNKAPVRESSPGSPPATTPTPLPNPSPATAPKSEPSSGPAPASPSANRPAIVTPPAVQTPPPAAKPPVTPNAQATPRPQTPLTAPTVPGLPSVTPGRPALQAPSGAASGLNRALNPGGQSTAPSRSGSTGAPATPRQGSGARGGAQPAERGGGAGRAAGNALKRATDAGEKK